MVNMLLLCYHISLVIERNVNTLINIEFPKPDVVIRQREQDVKPGDVPITPYFGFIDFHKITRDKGGIFLFYNEKNELLFVGKARKIRQRIKNILKTMYLR